LNIYYIDDCCITTYLYHRVLGHNVDPENFLKVGDNIYFRHEPRSAQVEPGPFDVIKAEALKDLFDLATMKFNSNGAENNKVKRHHTEGAEIIEAVIYTM